MIIIAKYIFPTKNKRNEKYRQTIAFQTNNTQREAFLTVGVAVPEFTSISL